MRKVVSIETSPNLPLTPEFIERRVYLIRGQKVMLDSDLAELYQVDTKNLNKAIKRNLERFPIDFMFQLSKKEIRNLRFQIGTSSWGGRRYLPYVFTELGVAMLSSVLSGERAIQTNIFIMRAFVKIRELLSTNEEFARKIKELENGQDRHGKHLIAISSVLKRLVAEQSRPKDAIGFIVNPE